MLKGCGISTKVVDFYVNKRKSWNLVNISSEKNETLSTVLAGEWKQHSGQPFTLDGNTMYNMMLIGICYKIQGMSFAAFKGDDSYIVADSVEYAARGERTVHELCGYKIKGFKVRIGEYISNIVTPSGHFFPDVVRRTSRILSKIYTSRQDWLEIRQSIADCLDVIEDDSALVIGSECAAQFYKFFNKDISAADIIVLVHFLKQMTTYDDISSLPIKDWRIETV